ncbi:DUF2889 domain-containing protein [Falsiroseomonas selenitidurans]|uniref:DUF2889 domain-containing protein n=1 Tax=Falsiroseomonas selenitidurans TaxID=2716335 RepID=A0ABX1E3T0_9PROT|nr:DUF2889 domain-containing protein [Falsiroseomonas selenitidurans]NKC31849.1 DUF2889 domain-containing protein [Falsiroseomonas selenitidurans]
MPLSEPEVPRQPLHRRQITLDGYQRTDGLFDIEAHLVDTKSYPFDNMDRGTLAPGDALHGMWVRMTVDEALVIQRCEAVSDFTPYDICPRAADGFSRLAGVAIGPGFNRAVKERVGGVLGCTHLREVMAQMATVAYQTVGPVKWRRARLAREAAIAAGDTSAPPPRQLPINSCYAYAEDSPVVRRHRAGGAE